MNEKLLSSLATLSSDDISVSSLTSSLSSLNVSPSDTIDSLESSDSTDATEATKHADPLEPVVRLDEVDQVDSIDLVDTSDPADNLGPHQPKNQRDLDRRSVYVSNIPFKISPWRLQQFFSLGTPIIKGCGIDSVNRVTILCDRYTGLPKGYAYVEFANYEDVIHAVNFDGSSLDGRTISVVPKRTNVPHPIANTTDSNTNSNSKVPEVKYKTNSGYTPHSNSNYTFMNGTRGRGRGRGRGNPTGRGNFRDRGNQSRITRGSRGSRGGSRGRGSLRGSDDYEKHHHMDNNNSINFENNKNRHIATSAPSKLVIDDNHYLTPSSRVGVYNKTGV